MTDIEKLKELEAKATHGRWQVGFNDGSGLGEYDTGYSIVAPEVAEDETVVFSGDNDGCLLGIRKKEDAEFIAAAKNALPALLAALGEAREALEPFCAGADRPGLRDSSLVSVQVNARHVRKARAARAKLNALEGNEDD